MNDFPQPTDDDDTDFDPTLDVLLREAISGASPPDFKRAILTELRESAQHRGAVAPPVVRHAGDGKLEHSLIRYALIAASLAASILIVAVLVKQQRVVHVDKPGVNETANADSPSSHRPVPRNQTWESSRDDARSLATDMPRENGSMSLDSEDVRDGQVPDASEVAGNATTTRVLAPSEGAPSEGTLSEGIGAIDAAQGSGGESLASRLKSRAADTLELKPLVDVSTKLDSTLVAYWNAIGVQPTVAMTDQELLDVLQAKLGVLFAREEIRNLEAVRRQITIPANSRKLADQFLQHMTGRGSAVPNDEPSKRLRDAFAECFAGDARVDDLLVGLTSGDHPDSATWYTAMSLGARHGLVNRIASSTMNQDVRCIRCHDSFIEARGTQAEYWAFTGMMFQSLSHEPGRSQWRVTASADSLNTSGGVAPPLAARGDVFYEAVDGRGVVVQPGVPTRWLGDGTAGVDGGTVDANSIAESDLKTWATSLRRSRPLAEGIVNLVWKMVHGRTLTHSVIDVDAAPRDVLLDELHQTLSDDLLASNFDLARTLALVITSPVTRRSIPPAFRIESAGQFVDAETEQAFMAFAAAKPHYQRQSVRDRLQTILTTSGATLRVLGDGGAMLAQPAVAADTPATSRDADVTKNANDTRQRIEIRDFPLSETDLPVAWLASINDETSRLSHLCYLAGRTGVPPVAQDADAAMKASDVPEPLRLNRIWWMIRP